MGFRWWGRGSTQPSGHGRVKQSPKVTSRARLSPHPREKKQGTRTCPEVPIGVEVSSTVQIAAVQDQHGVLVLLQLGLRVPHGPLEGDLAGQGQAQLLPEVRRWGLRGGVGRKMSCALGPPRSHTGLGKFFVGLGSPFPALGAQPRRGLVLPAWQRARAGGETVPTCWNLRAPAPSLALKWPRWPRAKALLRAPRLHAGASAGGAPGVARGGGVVLMAQVWEQAPRSGAVPVAGLVFFFKLPLKIRAPQPAF